MNEVERWGMEEAVGPTARRMSELAPVLAPPQQASQNSNSNPLSHAGQWVCVGRILIQLTHIAIGLWHVLWRQIQWLRDLTTNSSPF